MKMDKGWECFLKCPSCGAEAGFVCRTPKGSKKKSCHDTRPFFIPKLKEENTFFEEGD
jgi:hypothetical protein